MDLRRCSAWKPFSMKNVTPVFFFFFFFFGAGKNVDFRM